LYDGMYTNLNNNDKKIIIMGITFKNCETHNDLIILKLMSP